MTEFKTHGIRYLGSKNKIIPLIYQVIDDLKLENKTLIDVFTGTTRVAQAFKGKGYTVTTSDLSWASEAYSNAFICNNGNMQHMQPYIDMLNNVTPASGWITNNYCDVTTKDGIVIQVWKPKNGQKADAARELIENLPISQQEKFFLITSIIFALDKVDNTVGLQQAYLKGWKSSRVDEDMVFKMVPNIVGPTGQHIVGSALTNKYPDAEVAYLDPPYTPADYSTYYHIWDSITRWDKPQLALKTNRRVDRIKKKTNVNWDKDMVSPWYKKDTAISATQELVDRLPAKYCVFSYSDEGLITLDEMKKMCERYRRYEIFEKVHKRHVMSGIGAGAKVLAEDEKKNIEYVILIEK
jgi:adenine-specific DNA-methyltransferase